jgi:predicted nucleic acid-binding protein
MTTLVADTSALVSLGMAAGDKPDPLTLCLERYDVCIPEAVRAELAAVAAHEDDHGRAATAVLDRLDNVRVVSVTLEAGFPLDEGEHAAVTLANECDAALLLCDEFNSIGIVHASLADTRLVTTPTLLSVFVRTDRLSPDAARDLLDIISAARSWADNSYVQRARSLLADGQPSPE